MWDVTAEILDALEIGAGILGTGGGGNPYLGKIEALQQLQAGRTVQVVSLDEIGGRCLRDHCRRHGLADCRDRAGRPRRRVRARACGRWSATWDGHFTHVMPGEIGGSNSMRPMIVAAQTGLPVIDGDGMGRAFPELQMDTFTIYGVAPTPGTLADPRGYEVVFDRIGDAAALER